MQQCKKSPDVVRIKIKEYVERKKDLKRQMLSPPQVTNLDDDEMEEGEVVDLSLPLKSQKQSVSSSYGSTNMNGPIDTYFPLKPGNQGKVSIIEKIGPENVVQVVTDNATENVKAAHCVNLIFGDIFKQRPFQGVFTKAVKVHSYIVRRPLMLNMMKRFTHQRNLVKPEKARFATSFLTLQRMFKQKSNLRTMFISEEWNKSKFAKVLGKEVARIMLSFHFWNNVAHALKVCGPLVTDLRLADGEAKPSMGYEAMSKAKGANSKLFFTEEHKYAKVFEIIDKRWSDQLHKPLHATGNIEPITLF
ncbi:uncharacterized protein LOC124887125 [Capsicum annuum]|uniref:uncharacterized protein LOC124887125 n=1 Tax=Capsicum annuum TaxID=4072 RepID=UPI001FB149F7|nr:uncharacterized protein LOC124887125 [Capsicum annuum]